MNKDCLYSGKWKLLSKGILQMFCSEAGMNRPVSNNS